MTKTIVIIGGNGFLGSWLVKLLINEYNIIVIEQSKSLHRILKYNGKITIVGNDPAEIKHIFEYYKVDYIINTATFYGRGYEDSSQFIESNILMPLKIVETGIKNGVKAYLNTDTFLNCENISDYLNGYVISKKQVNEWLKILSSKIPVVNMKLQHMYGPGDNPDKFIPGLLKSLNLNEDIPLTEGQQKRDFIYIEDVVNAYKCILENEFEKTFTNIEVGTGKSVTIEHFALVAHRLIESRSRLLFGKLPYRKDEIMDSFADISLLKSFGWEPEITLIEGLQKTIKI